jgi:hypothetical protein
MGPVGRARPLLATGEKKAARARGLAKYVEAVWTRSGSYRHSSTLLALTHVLLDRADFKLVYAASVLHLLSNHAEVFAGTQRLAGQLESLLAVVSLQRLPVRGHAPYDLRLRMAAMQGIEE